LSVGVVVVGVVMMRKYRKSEKVWEEEQKKWEIKPLPFL
jgi:hypothetical protein